MTIQKLRLIGSCFCLAGVLGACVSSEKPAIHLQDHDLISGLASPVLFEPGLTKINIQDFVLDYELIDSITIDDAFELTTDDKYVSIAGDSKHALSNLRVWKGEQYSDIMLRRSSKQKVSLKYDKDADEVSAKGEFNAWNASNTVLKKVKDSFVKNLSLSPGVYQYLLVVDGKEQLDPNNPDSVSNGIGGWNSLIKIPRTDRSKLPILETTSFSAQQIKLESTNQPEKVFAYWQNQLLPDDIVKVSGKTIEINLPRIKASKDRSFLRVWACNNAGVSNDVLIPIQNNEVVNNSDQLTRFDKETSIFYFLMVDRFNNGNKENDEPVADPSIHPKANFYGGDIKGVTEQLESGYFESLGINTIWLSPISQNPKGAYGKYPNPKTTFSGYHGYWPVSSSKIDYRFGTDAELMELVNKAHEKDMNIVLDYVANHIHEEHEVYQNHKDWATDLYLPDGSMNTERWDDHRLTTWFDTFLPTLDFSKTEVVETMTDSALFWLEKYKIDGFRHDATKHIPLEFWRTLTRKVKKNVAIPEQKSVFQIGETYGSRELIKSYINTGMLDAQFDFNLYDDAVQTFASDETPFDRLVTSVSESIAYYGDHHLMGNITGNQDRARFISYADGSLRFDEDTKLAGWTRNIQVTNNQAYKKLNMLSAFMLSIPGIPVIYYGDEIGIPGGNDPDNRRMMKFGGLNEQEIKLKESTSQLIQLRKENLAMTYGDFEIVSHDHSSLVFTRKYFNNEIVMVFNKSPEAREIKLPVDTAGYSTLFNTNLNSDTIEMSPYSFEILTKTK